MERSWNMTKRSHISLQIGTATCMQDLKIMWKFRSWNFAISPWKSLWKVMEFRCGNVVATLCKVQQLVIPDQYLDGSYEIFFIEKLNSLSFHVSGTWMASDWGRNLFCTIPCCQKRWEIKVFNMPIYIYKYSQFVCQKCHWQCNN